MFFKEPKIEFVSIDAEEVLQTSGGGAAIDVCAEGSSSDDTPCYSYD